MTFQQTRQKRWCIQFSQIAVAFNSAIKTGQKRDWLLMNFGYNIGTENEVYFQILGRRAKAASFSRQPFITFSEEPNSFIGNQLILAICKFSSPFVWNTIQEREI